MRKSARDNTGDQASDKRLRVRLIQRSVSNLIRKNVAAQTEQLEADELIEDLCRQKSVFSSIALFVIAVLLLLHTVFSSILGRPSLAVYMLLALALVLAVIELLWLRTPVGKLTEKAVKIESCFSIGIAFALTALLTYITNRDESPYFVLLAIPILQCAYVFGLLPTVVTIVAADSMIFMWLSRFYVLHPPARIAQYLESGMLSLVYIQMGLMVWFLVHRLKRNQLRLSTTLDVLKSTRERLIREEKLAAVGRLASGIAHEIRNPVAMISSSLSTATHPETEAPVREEMFAIAAQESKRLELLTADFLTYARPSEPNRSPILMNELLSYISEVTKAHAARRSIAIVSDFKEEISIDIDVRQVEGALLNLVLNAIDATPDRGTIKLNAVAEGEMLTIKIQNSGPAIPAKDLDRIFEPFFTTKPAGTGLGLAIAKGASRVHGGDLWLSSNEDGRVTFSMTLRRTKPVGP
jgi:two-component system, NtrC family, sensor histidine kinase HydH